MEWLGPIWPISPQTLHYPSIHGGGIEHALSGSHHSPPAAAWSNASSSQTASHHGLLLLPFPHHRHAPPPPAPPRPDPPPPAQIRRHTAQSAAIQPSLGIPELLPPHPAADAASSSLIPCCLTPIAYQGVAIRMLQGRPRRRFSGKSDGLHRISRRGRRLDPAERLTA
jgi:hypothetical protein